MKSLAKAHEPRTQPALAKALKDFEMGRTDDEGRVASASVHAMATAGVKLDQTVIDGLWDMFSKFKLSKAQGEGLYHAGHHPLIAGHDPSHGDKAREKLAAPVNSHAAAHTDQPRCGHITR